MLILCELSTLQEAKILNISSCVKISTAWGIMAWLGMAWLNTSAVMCNTIALCKQFEMEKVVCSPKLRLELFTTAAIDNIDHNPSSTSAQGSLHGTSISVFQHFQNESNGVERAALR